MKKTVLSLMFVLFLGFTYFVFSQVKVTTPVISAEPKKLPEKKLVGPQKSKISIPPETTATGIYILDVESGETMYEKNPDLLVPPASTTKIVTALTAIDNVSLNDIVTIPRAVPSTIGQKMRLLPGEKISYESLIYGLLVFSGNDAAEALAQTNASGRQAFIEQMNSKAKSLGLTASTFKNPTGLDEGGQLTTAREMAILGRNLMQNSRLQEIVRTKTVSVYSSDLKIRHYLSSTNELLSSVPGVLGIKTGWTEEARENLITYIDRGHPIIISLFGSDDRFGETKELIDWVYKSFEWQ